MVIADDATLVQTLVQKKTLNDKKRHIVYFVLRKYSIYFFNWTQSIHRDVQVCFGDTHTMGY